MNKDQFLAFCLAQSNWWIAYANTPANKARKVYKGAGGYDNEECALTEDELIDDAMQTARNHLNNYHECASGINNVWK